MPLIGQTVAPLPYWTTTDKQHVKLYLGDVLAVLRRLPAQSVHCVMTSPPYWGLRDYGTGTWVGGDPTCDHTEPNRIREKVNAHTKSGNDLQNAQAMMPTGNPCRLCGAKRVDEQIGSEATPQQFVDKMVLVFREVRRVLRDDGTLWLNLGDTYGGGGIGGGPKSPTLQGPSNRDSQPGRQAADNGLADGNLTGIPWRVALALQADGWILRQDIIWHKPSPMPESVRNRCTKAHEYLFLFSKQRQYYYDAEAIKEKSNQGSRMREGFRGGENTRYVNNNNSYDNDAEAIPGGGSVEGPENRNKRSVWTIASRGYEGAHFATFPPKLVEPCILAGTSEHGCCAQCGKPWSRVTEEKKLVRERPNDYVKRVPGEQIEDEGTVNTCANSVAGVEVVTLGWEPTCKHEAQRLTEPCTVLDPFIGSGTVCCVALAHGRHSVGIDLSEKYLKNNAIPRIEGELLTRPNLAHLAHPLAPAQTVRKGSSALRK